jgi:hypothetical protein
MGLHRDVDRLLRGSFTRPEDLAAPRLGFTPVRLAAAALVLGALYGLSMGLYAILTPGGPGAAQLASSAIKVPFLFLLTLAVTFPSLYVFSALARSPLRAGRTLELLLAAVAVSLAILASLAPVTAFFTLSTESYPFMKLLNVAFFALAGLGGLLFLRGALRAAFQAVLGEGWRRQSAARWVLRGWVLIYAVVGLQMGWVLRPFIGAPGLDFALFRARGSSIFVDLPRTLVDLFR